eukprot:317706_1
MTYYAMTIIKIIILVLLHDAAAIIYCNYPKACEDLTYTGSDTVYSTGYRGVYGTSSSITSSSTSPQARSAFGFYDISTIITSNNIDCRGDHGCAKVGELSAGSSINAQGALAIAYSNITKANKIYSDGDQACAYSHIESTNVIHGRAAYSLLNARITTTKDINIYLRGHYAAYGATLHCNVGHECNIYCDGRTSCSMFYIICSGTCNVIKNSIDTIPPITNISQFNPSQDVLLYDSLSVTANKDAACSNQTNEWTFDIFQELKANITVSTSVGVMCCRSHGACSGTNITYLSPNKDALVCSGWYCCSGEKRINGDVLCTGGGACTGAAITTTETLYCLGQVSCRNSILSASVVYCGGWKSCAPAAFSNSGNLSIYLLGQEAGISSTVTCHDASDIYSIFCKGWHSCEGLTLSGNCDFYVECDADSLCPDGYTMAPTPAPTHLPTPAPTNIPTHAPSQYPSLAPSYFPSNTPSVAPTHSPTQPPSNTPTNVPTTDPTFIPSTNPTIYTTITNIESNDNNDANSMGKSNDNVLLILIFVFLFLICIGLAVLVYIQRKRSNTEKIQKLQLDSHSIINNKDLVNDKNNKLQKARNIFERGLSQFNMKMRDTKWLFKEYLNFENAYGKQSFDHKQNVDHIKHLAKQYVSSVNERRKQKKAENNV